MKHFFVVNPSAGKGDKVEKLMQTIRAVCENKKADYVLYVTTEVGDAERYTKEMCEACHQSGETGRVYACGGDGTINECVNGVVGFAGAEVAVIPIGTGNDFVRNFGGGAPFLDIEAQLEANTTPIDLIKYNDRYCVNMINIGFDCEVVVRTAKLKTHPLISSKFAYISGLLGEFIRKSGTAFRCKIDGKDVGERRLLLSLFANGGFCGGGFFAAPMADLSDGLMDFCFIRNISRFRFLSLVGRYKKGTHLEMKNRDSIFEYGKSREIELTFDQPRRICVDGEIETCERLHMQIEENVVRLALPKGICATKETTAPEGAAVV